MEIGFSVFFVFLFLDSENIKMAIKKEYICKSCVFVSASKTLTGPLESHSHWVLTSKILMMKVYGCQKIYFCFDICISLQVGEGIPSCLKWKNINNMRGWIGCWNGTRNCDIMKRSPDCVASAQRTGLEINAQPGGEEPP